LNIEIFQFCSRTCTFQHHILHHGFISFSSSLSVPGYT
jgi:hypothetical protein